MADIVRGAGDMDGGHMEAEETTNESSRLVGGGGGQMEANIVACRMTDLDVKI